MTMGGVLRLISISSAQLFCFGRLLKPPKEDITIKAKCATCNHNKMVLKDEIVICERCGGAW